MLSNAASKAASTTSRSFDKDIAIDVANIMINELEDSKYIQKNYPIILEKCFKCLNNHLFLILNHYKLTN